MYSDLGFDNGVYIPQYAGAPLAEIKDTADTLSTRHYQNLAQANQLGILQHQLRANLLPGAREYADQHIKAVDQALQDMAQNGGENSTARVNALVGQFSGDEKLIRAQQIAKARAEDTEAGNNIRNKTGKAALFKQQYHDYLNAGIDDPLYERPYEPSAAIELNPIDDIQQVLKEMHPDSWQSPDLTPVANATLSNLARQMRAGDIDVATFLNKASVAGLSQKKIDSLKKQMVESYKLTPSYKQQQDYKGLTEDQLASQITNYAPLKKFTEIGNQAIHNPDSMLKGTGGKQYNPGIPTYMPGHIAETMFPYDKDGKTKGISGPPVTDVLMSDEERASILNSNETGKMNPQAEKDLKTAKEIFGEKGTLEDYMNMTEERVANPVLNTIDDPTEQKFIDNKIQRQAHTFEYMDPSTGEVINMLDNNGNVNSNWEDLTGGDPTKFVVAGKIDAKNHFRSHPSSNEKFAAPYSVTAKDKDGNLKTFLVSTQPGPYGTRTNDVSMNQVYRTLETRPGSDTEMFNGKIKAASLVGDQVKNSGGFAIRASIPEVDGGKTKGYYSYEQFMNVLGEYGYVNYRLE